MAFSLGTGGLIQANTLPTAVFHILLLSGLCANHNEKAAAIKEQDTGAKDIALETNQQWYFSAAMDAGSR
jgi:hypothetical protein